MPKYLVRRWEKGLVVEEKVIEAENEEEAYEQETQITVEEVLES